MAAAGGGDYSITAPPLAVARINAVIARSPQGDEAIQKGLPLPWIASLRSQ